MIHSTTVLLLQIVIIPFSRCVSVVKTIFVCSKLSKMELRFDIQILLICLWNFASTLASDVGADLWGIEQCRDAGFSSANLLCSSCKGEARVVYLCVSLHFVHSTQSHAFQIYPFSQTYLNLGWTRWSHLVRNVAKTIQEATSRLRSTPPLVSSSAGKLRMLFMQLKRE